MLDGIFIGIPFALVALGFLFGFVRGLNRSILRIILVVVSLVGAFLLSHELSHLLLDLNIGERTVKEELIALVNSSDIPIPESVMNLIIAIFEIAVGVGTYFALFYLFKFVTWAIIFPVCKIFVRKGKPRRLWGGLVGVIQGLFISFVLVVPLSGMVYEVDKISKIEVDGHRLIEAEIIQDLDAYAESSTCKFYSDIGDWYFKMVTTVEFDDGKIVDITDVSDVVDSVVDLGNTAIKIDEHMSTMSSEESTPQEKLQAMKDLGDDFRHLEESIDGMGQVSKDIINEVVPTIKDMFYTEDDEHVEDSLNQFFDDFDVEKLDVSAAGDAMYGIATFIEKTDPEFENEEPVTEEEVNYIVDGISKNLYIVDLAVENGEVPQILDISGYEGLFEQAISSSEIDDFHKDELRQLFGLPIA